MQIDPARHSYALDGAAGGLDGRVHLRHRLHLESRGRHVVSHFDRPHPSMHPSEKRLNACAHTYLAWEKTGDDRGRQLPLQLFLARARRLHLQDKEWGRTSGP